MELMDEQKMRGRKERERERERCLLVAVAFALDLAEDVDAVVVAQGARHLVVVHRRVVLLDAPETGQTGRIGDLEDARFAVLPGDVVRVALAGIVEQLLQKVPQQPAVGARVQAVAAGAGAARRLGFGAAAAAAAAVGRTFGGRQRHGRHGRVGVDRRRRRRRPLRAAVLDRFLRIRLAARIAAAGAAAVVDIVVVVVVPAAAATAAAAAVEVVVVVVVAVGRRLPKSKSKFQKKKSTQLKLSNFPLILMKKDARSKKNTRKKNQDCMDVEEGETDRRRMNGEKRWKKDQPESHYRTFL